MKPEDLKSPFSWQDRHVVIRDHVWYVPEYYDQYENFTFSGWQHSNTFAYPQPIKVEYCSGNGAWIAAQAMRDSTTNWVAVEQQFVRARKIWSKLKNHQLNNLLVICGEGYTVTHHYFPTASVKDVFINFPDPWSKRRHAKHRIIQSAFIQEIERILQKEGILTFVTDDADYSSLMIEEMHQHTGFESCFAAPYFVCELPDYGTSYFEELWRGKGKQIRYHQFRKKNV